MTGSLSGLRVVNTRAEHQAAALDELLIERGAIPVSYPCIAIGLPEDPWDLDSALGPLVEGRFDWLVLTSANSVTALESRLTALGLPARLRSWTRIAAVGPTTAAAVQELFGVEPVVVPSTHTGIELYRAIPVERDQSVLLPRSEIGRDDVEVSLQFRGARVRTVVAYRNVTGEGGDDVPALLSAGKIDVLTFCSSSAVHGFVNRLETEGGSLVTATQLPAACMGPTTYGSAISHGFTEAMYPARQTLEGLLDVLDQLISVVAQGGNRWS